MSIGDNGYELIITRVERSITPYYRQRHRPEDNRQSVLAIKAEAPSAVVAARVGTGGDKLAKYDQNGRFYGDPLPYRRRGQRRRRRREVRGEQDDHGWQREQEVRPQRAER